MTTAEKEKKAPATADRKPEHVADRTTEHAPQRARVRTRNSSINHEDPYYVDLSKVPPDVSVEWKRLSNVGEENPFYIARMREQGWEPVNPQEHPDWVPVPPDYDKNVIIKGGQILMERPKALTDEARAENKVAAKQQVREAEQRLGMTQPGEMTRDHEGARPRVVKEMMRPIAIED